MVTWNYALVLIGIISPPIIALGQYPKLTHNQKVAISLLFNAATTVVFLGSTHRLYINSFFESFTQIVIFTMLSYLGLWRPDLNSKVQDTKNNTISTVKMFGGK